MQQIWLWLFSLCAHLFCSISQSIIWIYMIFKSFKSLCKHFGHWLNIIMYEYFTYQSANMKSVIISIASCLGKYWLFQQRPKQYLLHTNLMGIRMPKRKEHTFEIQVAEKPRFETKWCHMSIAVAYSGIIQLPMLDRALWINVTFEIHRQIHDFIGHGLKRGNIFLVRLIRLELVG